MPVRKYTKKKYILKQKPWKTKGIIYSNHRCHLFNIYKR